MNRKHILSSFKMPMWALTLKQPVASAVIDGHKIFETRGFRPGKVVEFAIHAGKGDLPMFDAILRQSVAGWPICERLHRGVLGVVRIVAVYEIGVDYMDMVSEIDLMCGFWDSGYAWKLEVVAKFDKPIAALGMPGFWKWHVDADARKRPGAPDWLKDNDGRISPDGSRFID